MTKFLAQIIFALLFSFQTLSAQNFSRVENLINSGISKGFFPGAQLIVGDKNGIIYSGNFGNTDFESGHKVTDFTIYDLASLTKVIAATAAIMKLYDEKKLDLENVVSYYIPEFGKNDKKYVRIKHLLLHSSGLKAWIPFYQTCKNKQDVINTISEEYLAFEPGSGTIYSDLNAILLSEIVERVTGKTFDVYCKENIFEPLGMNNTTFNPNGISKSSIAPTEFDSNWRMRLIHGEVHDEAASVMNGVSGNAGLFSNASDITLFMEMLLNNGEYTDSRSAALQKRNFVSRETIEKFLGKDPFATSYSSRIHGWDTKPEPTRWRRPCGELISDNCFGHTGFTGTSVWADRDREIFIVFLTNRVYPTRRNTGILELRPELHNMIIEILEN